MATKKTGISLDLIIHPGETIGDVLAERGITKAELAVRTGVSRAYVSNVIAGKKDISARFAMALEYALGVPKSFWLNLQANYDAEVLEANQLASITDEERDIRDQLKDIVKLLRAQNRIPSKESKDESILSLRRYLRISSLCNLNCTATGGAFRVASTKKTNPYILGAWVRMCQELCDDQVVDVQFDNSTVDLLINDLKTVMMHYENDIQKKLKDTLNSYGIGFKVVRNVAGAPVQGYITKSEDGTFNIFMTLRQKFADIFWFSLFHEIGHIVNGDLRQDANYVDDGVDSVREEMANRFASNALLNEDSYRMFLEKKDFTIESINNYALSQNVNPYIVIGRLQKTGYIDYNQYSNYKTRYEWAN